MVNVDCFNMDHEQGKQIEKDEKNSYYLHVYKQILCTSGQTLPPSVITHISD